ncbi:MAG: aminotransferase class V-fold PLP-dependent enzyme, partial [Phaeodactylibacter sp.]|nr:aminotransferase class V-fold PLP-dependent enzyme [Phaeodactylibacter sp.]
IFTSGATESDNLALKGVFELYRRKGAHIITVKTEHKAVLDACAHLEKMGAEVTYLDVDADGLISLEALDASIRPDTVLVSVMWANNETGVIQPMKAIGDICDKHGVLLMSDATQAVGKIPVDPKAAGVHLMAFTAHKMYGPKGAGALYVSRRQPRVKLAPQIDGGGHEQGMRSGTLNVPGIVGFGKAAELAGQEMEQEALRLRVLRDKLEKALLERVEESFVNGSREHRLGHVVNIAFRHAEAEGVMMTFNQRVALSSGSACTSASVEPSHVLTAMGRSSGLAHSSLRFSLGRFNTEEEVAYAIEAVVQGVEKVRGMSPVWELFKEGIL